MAWGTIRATATGQATTTHVVLVGLTVATTTAGTITLRNGTSGGQVLVELVSPANGAWVHVPIPDGLRFPNGIHVTFTTFVGSVTLWV